MNRSMWLWGIVAVIIIIAAVVLWAWNSSPSMMNDQGTAATTTQQDTTTTGTSTSMSPMSATVTYNGSTFSPSSVTIMQGGTVTFTSTAGDMWVASDPHPLHNGYDGTTLQQHCAPGYTGPAPFDQCSGGTSFTFIFDKVGSWGYHNHLNESVQGVVNVVAQ